MTHTLQPTPIRARALAEGASRAGRGLRRVLGRSAALLSCSLVAACSGEAALATGSVTVLLASEEVITHGIEAGDDLDNIRDGWNVEYDKFIVTIGRIRVHLSTDENVQARADEVFAVDLMRVPASGLPLWQLDDLAAGRWEFSFQTPAADAHTERHESVQAPDFAQLREQGLTYLIAGTLTQTGGLSCPPIALAEPADRTPSGDSSGANPCYPSPEVHFAFGATAETLYGPCELDGVPGFSVPASAQQTVAATLHGDHIFFNGFPEGAEGGIMRRAQWLADCDLDLDGTVTRAELQAIAPSALPEIDDDVQLGGSPVTPLDSMYDYLRGQLMTQGHMNGEGECAYNRIPPDAQ